MTKGGPSQIAGNGISRSNVVCPNGFGLDARAGISALNALGSMEAQETLALIIGKRQLIFLKLVGFDLFQGSKIVSL